MRASQTKPKSGPHSALARTQPVIFVAMAWHGLAFRDPMRAALPCAAVAAVAVVLEWARRRRARALLPLKPAIRHVAADSRAEEICAILQEDGVVVIDQVVPREFMCAVVKDLSKQDGSFYGHPKSFAGNHTKRNAVKPLGESAGV